jgi:heat shock protein HslJ
VLAGTRSIVVTGSLVLAALVSGSAALAQSEAPMDGPALEGTTWQLQALAGAADAAAVPGMGADLVLAGGTASGFGGCNQFTTSYTVDGSALSFGEPASTMMACDDAAMAFESVYLGALPTVASYTISGDTLELLDGTGTMALSYTAAATATGLVGTWTVTGVNNGAEAVVSVPEEPVLTVTFGADGSVAGFGGCNQFGGPYISGTDTVGIGPLHATMMACGDAVDTVEQQLLAALQASTVWSLRGDQLELRDDGGALQVSLVAGAPAASPSPA